MKKDQPKLNCLKFMFVALLAPVLFVTLGNNKVLAQDPPTVNGSFYGDGDNTRYKFLSSKREEIL